MMTTKQEQLKQIFLERRDLYNKTSAIILEQLQDGVLAGISQYFTEADQLGEGCRLEWEQVGYAEQYNMLVLLGMMRYAVGAHVKTETGDVVVVTEELAPYFERVIRVGLPFNMVDQPKEKVKEFLQKQDLEAQEEQAEAVEFLRNLLKVEDEPTEVFDLDTLTEEQRMGLVIPKGGKPN